MTRMLHLAVLLSLAVPPGPTAVPTSIPTLSSALLGVTEDSEPEDLVRLTRIVLEAGPAALSQLLPHLKTKDKVRSSIAAFAIAFTGHSDAPGLLLDHYLRQQRPDDKATVCFALPQRGTADDVRFLVRALEGEPYGDSWQPIQCAALALGVLRATSAVSSLQKTADGMPGTISGQAARDALDWIRSGSQPVSPRPGTSVDELILAVVANGVPRMSESTFFAEPGNHRIWNRYDGVWFVQPAAAGTLDTSHPTISFETFQSSDQSRAIVSVALHFGRLNGVGYDYLLFRKRNSWRVVGILPTWIS